MEWWSRELAEWTSIEGEGLQIAVRAGVNGLPVIPAAHTDSHTAAVWAGANPTTQQPQGTTGAATAPFSLHLEGTDTRPSKTYSTPKASSHQNTHSLYWGEPNGHEGQQQHKGQASVIQLEKLIMPQTKLEAFKQKGRAGCR